MAYATVAQLADALGKTRGLDDIETDRAVRCVDAATAEVDAAIGWHGGIPAPDTWTDTEMALAVSVALVRAVEWWKANDAAFGVLGSAELGQLRVPREGFARHWYTLVPLIERFAVA